MFKVQKDTFFTVIFLLYLFSLAEITWLIVKGIQDSQNLGGMRQFSSFPLLKTKRVSKSKKRGTDEQKTFFKETLYMAKS